MKSTKLLLIIFLIIFFNCSSTKNTNSDSNTTINIQYIKEIKNYSHFKKLINKDFDCKSVEQNILRGITTGAKQTTTKCHNIKSNELVYVSFISKGDTYISQKYFYKNKALVFIKTEAIDKNKDSIFNEIYVKNDSIYYNRQQSHEANRLVINGVYYLNNFNYE
ncbi:hypothetical protein [Olleya sp. 1-3]|uniref:hypothetical protein n=1 Tax=Olleya sp. 1-3 TaxID=2058323 RepID=UPI000C321414|nr:hypothetical protein [Olleya sp. 1-3]PKG52399.1 hypothetical protein CXF54_04835 [Olleya sp. 1-3]